MDYNSTRQRLVLPEYGRHIHNMVAHAVTITDKEERTRCANSIINIMGNLFPHLRDYADFKHKLWDHLAIMSDFKLDIDYPYDITNSTILSKKPEKLPYKNSQMKFLHYGQIVEELIAKALLLENETERQHLITLIANHMKKSLMMWNKDTVTDDRILNDIKLLSGGRLQPDENFKTAEFNDNSFKSNNLQNIKNKKRKFINKNYERRNNQHPKNNQ
jgi:hypothetical protein